MRVQRVGKSNGCQRKGPTSEGNKYSVLEVQQQGHSDAIAAEQGRVSTTYFVHRLRPESDSQ